MNKRLFAVIHVEDEATAKINVEIAKAAGCDGAFVIAHGRIGWPIIGRLADSLKTESFPVGVNFLDLGAAEAVGVCQTSRLNCWTDELYTGRRNSEIEIFGGFAFKHQPYPYITAGEAAMYVTTLTTSGTATGQPICLKKLRAIHADVGGQCRIGLASGVSKENVRSFLPFVDDFLVASAISESWVKLCPRKTARLAAIIHGLDVQGDEK